MKVAYIAGPYRARKTYQVMENIDHAKEVAKQLWMMGYVPICPHLNSAFFDGLVPDEQFIVGYVELAKRCDLVVRIDGWESSDGATKEIAMARRMKIPVYEWQDLLEGRVKA